MFEGIKKWFGAGAEEKAEVVLQEDPPAPQQGMLLSDLRDSILKAVQPQYLYSPPFGYPRKVNTNALRELAKNPYVFSVIKTLADEASSTDWDIVERETNEEAGITPKEDVRKQIKDFLDNPNINQESFDHILRQAITDILETDSGVWVKVFSKEGKLVQLYARDGASFLKNTDIYGTMTARQPFVEPLPQVFVAGNKTYFDTADQSVDSEHLSQRYSLSYAARAAYFQYGQAFAAWPIPFGTREIIYFMANPRADDIYGRSPLEVLADIVLTLVYGSKYNLDFYLNNNMAEGALTLEGAPQKDVIAFSNRLTQTVRDTKDALGFRRRMGYRVAVTNHPVKFERFQMSPNDMQVIEQQKWFDRMMLRCFGMTENEMGTTDDSNKAVAATQSDVFKRKALKPILSMIEYHINTQILTEFEGSEGWEFKFDDYDLDEDIRKYSLYESQIRMGVQTPEMIAKEEGIDVKELVKQKDENMQKQQDLEQSKDGPPEAGKAKDAKKPADAKKDVEGKAQETNEVKEYIKGVGKEIVKMFDEEFPEGFAHETRTSEAGTES